MGRLGGFAPEEAERGEKALWLAGGGFRAALFHLGALTRLNELGLLAQTGTVGAVGGGSVLAAFLTARVPWPLHGSYRDWPEQVAEPLREAAGRRALPRRRLRALGRGAEAKLEEHYARELTAELGGESEWGPRLVFGDSGLTLSGLAAGWEESLEWSLEEPSPGGYGRELVAATIGRMPRDLRGIGRAGAAVLENHGYLLADAALRAGAAEIAPGIEPLAPLPPHPRWLDPELARAALGGRRLPLTRARRALPEEPQSRSPELTALLERHRPVVRYDSLECCPAGSAAAICTLALTDRRNSLHRADGSTLAAAASTRAASVTLAAVPRLELDFLGPTYTDGREARGDDYLDESGGSLAADALAQREAEGAVVYGRARRDGGTTWLQYWFFFYFTDRGHLGYEQQEGGWELVQVRLDGDAEVDAATFARRGGPERLEREQLEMQATEDGPVAVIYPARGSHAPLPGPGTYRAPTIPDHSDGGGTEERPRLVPIGDDGPSWVRWPGRWGATRRREYFEADSPRGPGTGPEWWDPAELHRGARPWRAEALGNGFGAPPAPLLRVRSDSGELALVEYSFPPRGAGDAAPARLVAAPFDATGTVGPALSLRTDPDGGGQLRLQLPRGREWVGVRAGAASERGVAGVVASGLLTG